MKKNLLSSTWLGGLLVLLAGVALALGGQLFAKDKNPPVSSNDPTAKLFNILDSSYEGKLSDYYVLADIYKDPDHPDEEWQHILRVEYDKKLFFGKFKIYVCGISKPTPDQLKVYTVKQLYDFGSPSQKFEKIDAGPFGQKGDLYLRSQGDSPLATTPITPEIQGAYDKYIMQYLIPALEKPKTAG